MSNFGIDLLFASQKDNIKNDSDVLMILVHWVVTKSGFRNVGIGDNKIYNEEDRLTELLPEDWNIDPKLYVLRYVLNKQIYILYGIRSDDMLILNFLNPNTLNLSNQILSVDKLVKSKTGTALEEYMNESDTIIKRLETNLIKSILEENSSSTKEKEKKSVAVGTPASGPRGAPLDGYYRNEGRHDPLRDIGRGDLDPFGRGGGMLFQPPGIGGPIRPDYRRPPGARFDPINPMNPFDIRPPNPDHMRPPGYDDMFM